QAQQAQQQALQAPPRPPQPSPLDDDEATAEIDIPGVGHPHVHPPPVVVVNHGATTQQVAPPSAQHAPSPSQSQGQSSHGRPASEGRVSTATQPMSTGPATAKAPPPSAALKDGKE